MSSIIQNIIFIGGLIAILGLGYFIYTQNTGLDTEGDSNVNIQIEAESAEFVRRLKELQAIELRGDIFDDPRFLSLLNFAAPVVSEPVGSNNPFARSQ